MARACEQEAKADIVDNDQSKRQLKGDVRLLYDLLDRARRERRSYDTVVGRLEGSVAQAESRTVEVRHLLCLYYTTVSSAVIRAASKTK